MAITYGPSSSSIIASGPVTSGCVLHLDAGNYLSYGGQNHLTQSEDFSNSTAWNFSTFGTVVTSNAITAPDGTLTADLVTGGPSNPTLIYHNQLTNIPALYGAGAKIVSVYAKQGTSTSFTLNCYWDGETETNVTYNVANGTVTGDDRPGVSFPTIQSVGNGWYFCSFTVPARTGAGTTMSWRVWASGRGGTGTGVYLWGAQQRNVGTNLGYIKTTTTPFDYSRTTWFDISGSANNMTLTGTPTLSNGVLQFDGTTQDGTLIGLNLATTNYTVMTSSRYSGYINGRIVNSYTNNWLLGHHNNGIDRYYAEGWVSLPSTQSDRFWRIYTGTGNIAGDVYSFYRNTELVASNNGGAAGPNGLTIGRYSSGSTERSTCEVGFLLAYNRVLSISEIRQNVLYFQNLRSIP
jgi:hypothetical protein